MPKLFHKTLYLNPVTSLQQATRRPEGSSYFSGNFGRGRDKSRQRSQQLPSSRNRITDITEVAAPGFGGSDNSEIRINLELCRVPDRHAISRENETHVRPVLHKRRFNAKSPLGVLQYSRAKYFGAPMG